MISPISFSNVNNTYKQNFVGGGLHNKKSSQGEVKTAGATQVANNPNSQKKKEGLSPEQQTLIALGAAAVAVTVGVLVKKHINNKAIEDAAKKMLDKPSLFNEEYVGNYAENLRKAGKLGDDDAILCIPKTSLDKLFADEDGDLKKIYSKINLSENGFVMVPARLQDGIFKPSDFEALKFVDPQANVMLRVVNELKNGRNVVFF